MKSVLDQMGGETALRKLVESFYDGIEKSIPDIH